MLPRQRCKNVARALDDASFKSRRLIGAGCGELKPWLVGRVWLPWLPRLLCVAVCFLCDVRARVCFFVWEEDTHSTSLFVFFWDLLILELIPMFRLFRRKISKSKVHGNSI